jgi:hypothetical protein
MYRINASKGDLLLKKAGTTLSLVGLKYSHPIRISGNELLRIPRQNPITALFCKIENYNQIQFNQTIIKTLSHLTRSKTQRV